MLGAFWGLIFIIHFVSVNLIKTLAPWTFDLEMAHANGKEFVTVFTTVFHI